MIFNESVDHDLLAQLFHLLTRRCQLDAKVNALSGKLCAEMYDF